MLTSLLNTALLGTAKQPFQPAHDTPAVLQQYWQQLAHATPEDRFYQFSALSHAYYYGGQALAHSHSPDWQALPTPPDNSHEHIVPATLTPLHKTWIQQHNDPLLRYAFQQLAQHRQTQAQVSQQARIVKNQQKLADLARQRYQAGMTPQMETLGLQAAALSAQDALYANYAARRLQEARLANSLGIEFSAIVDSQ